MTEAQLAKEAAEGNQMAFIVLYERFKARVDAFVAKMVHSKEEVEDIVMESFQKAFSQIDSYNPQYRFSTWIFNIAKNTALDHNEKITRSAANMPSCSIDDEKTGLSGITAPGGNPEADVISDQGYEKLVAAINGLAPNYCEIAKMVLLENYGYQEVAEETGLALNTVKTRIKRAREILVRVLGEDNDEQQ